MGGRPNLVYSAGPGLWALVLGPSGPDLGPDLDLTWDLDLDLSLTKKILFFKPLPKAGVLWLKIKVQMYIYKYFILKVKYIYMDIL